MQIIEVNTRRQLEQFIAFPDRLYAACPQYVPALHSDQRRSLMHSPSLEYCKRRMWLAVDDGGKVTGRICAMINPHYNEFYDRKCCRFGWFDVIDDSATAKALVDTASAWAKEQGMEKLHGPLYYNTLGKQGMLVEGFENLPQFNNLYNFPYYPSLLESLGFEKECDWVQYQMDGFAIPERLEKISERLMERYKLHFGSVSRLKSDRSKVEAFMQMYSDTFAGNVYNFIPFTENEKKEEIRSSFSMLSDKYCLILLDENEQVAAFGINFPSISRALQKARGSLFPLGWLHLLKALYCKNENMDLVLTGSAPQWQGKGLTAVLHVEASRRWKRMGIRKSVSNPQIEDNPASQVWQSYETAVPYMRRRCYIKNI